MKRMLIICGKSGSGKNYIPEVFGLRYTPGNTTRKSRPNDPIDLKYSTTTIYKKFKKRTCLQTYFDKNTYWTWIEDFNMNLYDFVVASPEAIKNFIKQVKLKEIDIERPYKFIYFKCSLLRRIKNMRKRGDSWTNIIRRILHDKKAFKDIEEFILDNNGEIFIS